VTSPLEAKPSADTSLLAVDPAEILNALKRRKWLILAATVAVGGAVAAGTHQQPRVYHAKAQILIDPAVPRVLGESASIENIAEQARQERSFQNTQFKIIKSRTVLEDVAQRLSLTTDADYLKATELQAIPEARRLPAVVATLTDAIRIEPEGNSRVVSLVVEDRDPERAARLAEALGSAYIDHTLESRLDTTRRASRWLDAQVTKFADKLEEQESALNTFKQQNQLVSVSLEDRQNMTSASLAMLNQRLLETRARLIQKRAQRKVIDELLQSENPDPDAIPQIHGNAVVSELKSALVQLEKQKAEHSTRYGDKHPKMVALDKQLDRTNQALKHEIDTSLAALNNEILAEQSAEVGLQEEIEAEKKRALALNAMGLEYSKLTRNLGTTKKMYESLLKRQTEADLSGRLDSNFVRWFERPEPILSPIRPSLTKNTAVGILAGLLLGMLIVIGGVLLDNTVHRQADIEQLLGLPFLGVFPKILETQATKAKVRDRGYSRDRDLYVSQNPKSVVAECARSVRTNLMFMATDRPYNRLLFTSARPSEGKTTTAISVGVSMAQAGNRVLLLDTDLRKPRLHRAFGVSGEEGLTSVLVGESLQNVIKQTDVADLFVLPCGPTPPNPAELLHTEKFAKVLDELSELYDRVILDSPPVGAVTDASILSRLVDATILVVQAHQTPKEAVRRAGRQLRDVGANLAGVLLNDCDLGASDEGHYYYYRSYGHGADEDKAKA